MDGIQKQTFGDRFRFTATKRPVFFYGVLLAGLAMFLWLTMSTTIETDEGLRSLLYVIFAKAGKGI